MSNFTPDWHYRDTSNLREGRIFVLASDVGWATFAGPGDILVSKGPGGWWVTVIDEKWRASSWSRPSGATPEDAIQTLREAGMVVDPIVD